MSNIVLILGNAYENFENELKSLKGSESIESNKGNSIFDQIKNLFKQKKLNILILIILIVSIIFYGLALFLKWNSIVIIVSIVFYSIAMFCIILKVDKNDVKNCIKRKENYFDKIKMFKEQILDEKFSIKTKVQLEQLIKECDEVDKELKDNNKMIKNGPELWKNVMLPIITFLIGAILKLDKISKEISLNGIAVAIMLLVLFLAMILGAYIIIKTLLDPIFNTYINRNNKLKTVLNDIYLMYYIDN